MSDICLVFIIGPEESIALISSVKAIADVCSNGIATLAELPRQIVGYELDSSVVVRPARVNYVVGSWFSLDCQIEAPKTGSKGYRSGGLSW